MTKILKFDEAAQTELNAAGKNASTTGLPCSLLSVTGSRS